MANVLYVIVIISSSLPTQGILAVMDTDVGVGNELPNSPSADPAVDKCDCASQKCREVIGICAHGLVSDRRDLCGCCKVCGNRVGKYCDPDDESFAAYTTLSNLTLMRTSLNQILNLRWDPREHYFGQCGWGLCCMPNVDFPSAAGDGGVTIDRMKPVDMVCLCKDDDMVCGSDGVTYENPCLLREAAAGSETPMWEAERGMCPGVPDLVTAPTSVSVRPGERALLRCETCAKPVPGVEWRRNGHALKIPGDNTRYLVHSHGGPEKFMITTWLDIINVTQEDAGIFECLAINDYGIISGTASIYVT